MKRPAGVTVSAVALSALAAFTLLFAAMTTFSAFVARHPPAVPVNPSAPPLPPEGFVFGILLIFALITAAFGVLQIFTVVGLLRLRSWARYSVLVIGGILTFLGVVSLLALVVVAVMMPRLMAQANTPQAPPHLMQIVLVIFGLIYGAIAALGIWWLVYFNLRRTRQAFTTAYAIDPVFYPGEPGDPQLYRGTGRFLRTPTSVMVFAWLYVVSAALCLLFCWLPFPAYLMGFVLTGVWPHLLFLMLGLLMGLMGWGLMRLDNRARLATYGLIVYAFANFSVMLTPWGRARYGDYQTAINERMGVTVHQPQLFNPTSLGFVVFMVLLCVAFYGVQVWVLQKHKRAFTTAPPPMSDVRSDDDYRG